jgi:hypothetical protein
MKLLLLGSGESGKSTIFKQLNHIYNKYVQHKLGRGRGGGWGEVRFFLPIQTLTLLFAIFAYCSTFQDEDARKQFKSIVHYNLLMSMKTLVHTAQSDGPNGGM